MIRELPVEEIERTEECARAFFDESRLPGTLDLTYWNGRWRSIISELDIGAILVYESDNIIKGLLGGLCVRCTMTGDLEAIEAFWYMMPEFRGGIAGIKLIKAFEQWGKDRGALRIKMMHLSDLNAKVMEGIYIRMGYTPLEVAYSKSLVN